MSRVLMRYMRSAWLHLSPHCQFQRAGSAARRSLPATVRWYAASEEAPSTPQRVQRKRVIVSDNDTTPSAAAADSLTATVVEKPKRRGVRTKKTAATLNLNANPSSSLSTAIPATTATAPVRRPRAIRSTAAAFQHIKPPAFGVQDVLSLLYTYLPKPSTVLASQAASPSPSTVPPPVTVFDVHSRSIFNDFVVVVLCTSSRQMSYIAQAVYKLARARDACAKNRSILSHERRGADDWMMVDMGSVIMHVFNVNANITQPSLDYISPLSLDSPSPPQSVRLARHPVVDAIERQFSDCMVPLEQHLTLVDYSQRLGTDAEPVTVNEAH